MDRFVQLHSHREWSILDGCGTAAQFAIKAAELGQPYLSITDHGNLCGALHHIKACEDVGVIPIVGMEAYFKPDRLLKDASNKEYYHLVLLAKNEAGWRNLLRLSSEANASGFYYKPCIDWELLEKHKEGLIGSASCLSGFVPQALIAGEPAAAEGHIDRMLQIFGDDFYFELQPHDIPEQRQYNVEAINIAQRRGIPITATTDAHYPSKEWAHTHDVLLMINTGQTLATRKEKVLAGEDFMQFTGDTFYLMSREEVVNAFAANHPEIPFSVVTEACDNTLKIAERVVPFVVDKSAKIPRFVSSARDATAVEALTGASSIEDTIRAWCEEGLRRIGCDQDEVYRARMETELTVLRDKGILDYIAIIGELVRWAKSQGIRVGAGRGSAAGSLVSYLCRITAIDPIGHGLLFERFINPERAEPPDIDIDFQHNRRSEVKQHLADVYGADHVADIAAFQTFGMRRVLQDVCRVLDVPYEVATAVTKSLDDGTGDLHLIDMLERSETLAQFVAQRPDVWEHALRLEGQVRTQAKHAAGVVVTDKPVSEYMPTMRSGDESTVTQWSEKAEFPIITEYGFMKIDCLGIDALTVQAEAAASIFARTGEVVDFEDLDRFPVIRDPMLADQDVIEAFADGANLGVFQFESHGICGLLREIKPDRFDDIVAANALYRPGPIEGGVTFDYPKRKNGQVPVDYWHELVEPYLKGTYGIMAFQEQVMQVVRALGDFTLAEADIVRKAMTKWQSTKIKTNVGRGEMEKFRDKFVDGCKAKGITPREADSIWEKIIQFSIYGFNKSHSAGYALGAYQDKWLKMRYPLDMYAALLTWETGKVPRIIREGIAAGVNVLPPDINKSAAGFAITDGTIRFGFDAVKFVGPASVVEILAKRPFESYEQFCDAVIPRACNSRVKDSLVRCGAFDSLGGRSDWKADARAEAERELLGYALSSNAVLTSHNDLLSARIFTRHELEKKLAGDNVVVGGEVVAVKEITTKKGDAMAFVDLAFGSDQYSVTFFPGPWKNFSHLLGVGLWPVLVKGSWDPERDAIQADNVCTVDQLVTQLGAK